MRVPGKGNGVTITAYAGSTGVLLAMNVTAAKRRGLLGFAIERSGTGGKRWLNGLLDLPGRPHKPGDPIPTQHAPIQKFRWSDYTVFPNSRYRYTVHPVYTGSDGMPEPADGASVEVKTHRVDTGDHSVLFNRAAAASQAFSRDFPEVDAAIDAARKAKRPVVLPPRALDWLTRGVRQQIVGFIDAAGKGDALDVAIYEYELEEIIRAVEAAHARGVAVRIVYHAQPGDEQTVINKASVSGLPPELTRARITSKIHHHKYIVRSKIDAAGARTPVQVLAGSTNFTENGVYRQGNVVHVVRRADAAAKYLALFEVLFRGDDVGETRTFNTDSDPIDKKADLFVGFSPRSGLGDLEHFSEVVDGAKSDVLFCTAFDLYDKLEESLLGRAGDPILRYGLQNTKSQITGFHADRSADFAATAMLNRGLEGVLKESLKGQKGAILIHTKLIVVDFTTNNPTVISGSHNLSKSASDSNDENFLIIRGDTDVADCYGVELMRLYDHYRFRWYASRPKAATAARSLVQDDSWTAPYFEDGTLKRLDRLRFSGARA
jgi:phosphatidylserine/phosphatidylglycerophosphate/cardiolipin synthase-like enzyme